MAEGEHQDEEGLLREGRAGRVPFQGIHSTLHRGRDGESQPSGGQQRHDSDEVADPVAEGVVENGARR